METKTYVVNDMAEAVKKMREELGPEAIIITTQEIKPSGLFGFWKEKKLEVTAGVEKQKPKKPKKPESVLKTEKMLGESPNLERVEQIKQQLLEQEQRKRLDRRMPYGSHGMYQQPIVPTPQEDYLSALMNHPTMQPMMGQGQPMAQTQPMMGQGQPMAQMQPMMGQGQPMAQTQPMMGQGQPMAQTQPMMGQGQPMAQTQPMMGQGQPMAQMQPMMGQGQPMAQTQPMMGQGQPMAQTQPMVEPLTKQISENGMQVSIQGTEIHWPESRNQMPMTSRAMSTPEHSPLNQANAQMEKETPYETLKESVSPRFNRHQAQGILESKQKQSEDAQSDSSLKALEQQMQGLTMMLQQMQSVTPSQTQIPSALNQAIESLLDEFDFDKRFIAAFRTHLEQKNIKPSEVTLDKLYEFLEMEVNRLVQISETEIGATDEFELHVFVGPPGVGKTTTLAKIATDLVCFRSKKVGMITVDEYRLGAVAQLMEYSDILGTPFELVKSKEEMELTIQRLKDEGCEVLLIDSMGCSPQNQDDLNALNDLILPANAKDIYLVLNATVKLREMLKTMEKFEFVGYNQLIFTKLDESERNENMIGLAYEKQCPISYLCVGQEVPKDIKKATKEQILHCIWGEISK